MTDRENLLTARFQESDPGVRAKILVLDVIAALDRPGGEHQLAVHDQVVFTSS